MKTNLIFEPQSGGHRANFVRWLRDAAPEYSGYRFVFFTADDVEESVSAELSSAGWWKKQQLLYQLFRRACGEYRPDHVLVLELTHLELPLVLFGSPVPVSAILFVQYPELSRGLKKASKHWKTRLLFWRAPVKNLFLLNGEKSCLFLAKHFGRTRTKFIPIPDPAPEASAEENFNLRDYFNVSKDRKIFLFFGAISKRKGADVLLEALHQISSDAAKQSTFVFCGEPEVPYKNEFQISVAEVRDLGAVDLYIENTFVSDERMMALFEQADVILMPYTRPEYSSGILALAAKARTPVLGPADGLLGRLITENDLGATARITPTDLAEAIARPVCADETKQRAFFAQSRGSDFSKIILNAICDES